MSGVSLLSRWILFGIYLCFYYHIIHHVTSASTIYRRPAGIFSTPSDPKAWDYKTNKPYSFLTYQNSSTPCPIFCFLRPPDNQMVACVHHPSEIQAEENMEIKIIECREYKSRGEIVLGNRESVRGIEVGALGKLLTPGEELPTSAGQLSIYLNLNMVRLDPGTFQGLETVITEVRLINTVQMHPNSFLALKHLRAFEIESGRTPKLWISETESNQTEVAIQHAIANMPMYIRLQPADTDVPISFNLETTCHQCVEINSTEATYLIIVFRNPSIQTVRKKVNRPVGFSMLFPQTCPKLSEAPGCSEDWDNYDTGSPTGSATINWLKQSGSDQIIVQQTSNPSLLILLAIWCTILTIVILLIVGIVYWCTRRLHHQKPLPRWLPLICATQQSSFEDVSLNSSNTDFRKQPDGSLQMASGTLLNSVLNGSRGSWNSLRAGGVRSRSSHSLKDRSLRVNRYYPTLQNQRTQRGDTCRRSIGSQTDFTELNTEATMYSSLRRYQLPMGHPFHPDPPFRTSSHYALSRAQYLNKMDAIYPRIETRNNRYSLGCASIHDTIENGPCTHHFTSVHEQNPEFTISKQLQADLKLLIHPPVRSLPPVPPISKMVGDSPTPWRRSLQNGSLLS